MTIPGHEGLGTVITRAAAIAAAAGFLGVLRSATTDVEVYIKPPGEATAAVAPVAPVVPVAPLESGGVEPSAPGGAIGGALGESAGGAVSGTLGGPPDTAGADGFKIGLEEAARLWEAGAVFVDARLRPEFERGHIAGAVNFIPADLNNQRDKAMDIVTGLDPTGTLVIYCYGGTCESSELIRDAMVRSFGFTDIRVFTGTFAEWSGAGLATEAGDDRYDRGEWP